MLITAYIDESGTHNSGVTVLFVVAGNAEQWANYESETKTLFKRTGISVYHAKELKDSDGDFRAWKVRQKGKFIDDFADIINRTLELSFSVVLRDDEYEEYYAKGLQRLHSVKNTRYGICFRAAVSTMLKAAQEWKTNTWPDGERLIDFIAEDGHVNQESTLALYSSIKTHVDEDIRKMLGTLSFKSKRDCLPIAAADHGAYNVWRLEKGHSKTIAVDWPLKGEASYRGNNYRVAVEKDSLLLLREHMTQSKAR